MISVVICSITPAKYEAVLANLRLRMGNEPWELIGIHDARSMAEAYNQVIPRLRGDIVILCHDDIELLNADFTTRLKRRMSQFDIVGVAGTTRLLDARWVGAGIPYLFGQMVHVQADGSLTVDVYGAPRPAIGNIQAVDGAFMAVRRSVLNQIKFDAVNFDHFHIYDIDFCMSAYTAGLRLGVANDIHTLHFSGGTYDDDNWKTAAARFRKKWASRLRPPPKSYMFNWAVAFCNSREHAIELMTPAYWQDAEIPTPMTIGI
jgi:GT2 family glycosyltransferase